MTHASLFLLELFPLSMSPFSILSFSCKMGIYKGRKMIMSGIKTLLKRFQSECETSDKQEEE